MRIIPLLIVLIAAILPAQDPTDAQHAFLDIELLPASQTVSGNCTWTVKSKVAGLASFTLQLHDNFSVSSVTSSGVPAVFTRPAHAVQVTLDRAYNVDEVFTVGLSYAGPPAGDGFGSFGFQTHGNPPATLVYSLSEPFYAYTWWPNKDTLTDKFTTAMWITVPDNLYAVSNGILQGTDSLPGARLRYRWTSNYPIATYGVAVTATNYQIRTDAYTHLGASMPVIHYAYPESFAGQQTGMNRIVPMLTTFSDLFGQYPFANEKYGICQFNWGGGMEHQTISSQANWGEYLSAHELAHSWWGNSITCATWHDIGLNEGFATYSEALWAEFRPGGSVSAYFSRMNSNKPSNPGGTGSVWVANTGSVNSIFSTTNVYRKGAWVLHQLRHVAGDAAFFQILRDYHAAKQYESATWDDFKAIASASAGQDLAWFVDQCVLRPGAPSYRLSWSNRTISGQPYVFGNIVQTQAGAPWRFPVDIAVNTASGTVVTPVWCDQDRDDFVVAVPGPASSVQLDPAPWILRGSTTTGAYAQSLTAAPASVSASSGGAVTLALDAGPGQGGRSYLVGASATGVWPGLTLPDGKRLPLAIDDFTFLVLSAANGPVFQNFSGTLNGNGQATAQIVLPPLGPIPGPVPVYFAFVATGGPSAFVSNPVLMTLTP